MSSTYDKVGIVTAAGQGIGAACARALKDKGYQLVLMSRTEEVQKLAEQLEVISIQGSVAVVKDLENLVETTLNTFGKIDVVVNNTGHAAKGDLIDLSDEDWHQGLDLLLLNVIRMTRLVTPVMEKQGQGAWVNISTFAAFEPSLDFPISSTIRASLGSFAKLYSDRYAAKGIRMNNLLPGYVNSYPVSEEMLSAIPMKRPGLVEEIGQTAAFLLSSDASYITGQNIRVDGGFTRSV